jgi:hypothetical protein
LLPALPACPSCCALISRTQMRLCKGDEARRIAANIAKLAGAPKDHIIRIKDALAKSPEFTNR